MGSQTPNFTIALILAFVAAAFFIGVIIKQRPW